MKQKLEDDICVHTAFKIFHKRKQIQYVQIEQTYLIKWSLSVHYVKINILRFSTSRT